MKLLLSVLLTFFVASFSYAHCGGSSCGLKKSEAQGSRFTRMYSGKKYRHAKKSCCAKKVKCHGKKRKPKCSKSKCKSEKCSKKKCDTSKKCRKGKCSTKKHGHKKGHHHKH